MDQNLQFEEYKLFIDDTARFTDRRQGISNTFLTVNSIFLSVVALLVKDAGLEQVIIPYAVLLILFAGLVICVSWHQQLERYRRLLSVRFNALEDMEDQIHGSYKMYHLERAKLYPRQDKPKRKRPNFSNMEKHLPKIFGVIYGVSLVALVVAMPLGMV